MSASMYRSQLDRKRAQRVEAERKAGEYRIKESNKRTDAAKARQSAAKSTSSSTISSKMREAERRENEAASAGADANRWQAKAAGDMKEESTLIEKVAKAEASEAAAADRKRRAEEQAAERRRQADQRAAELARRSMESQVVYAVATADAAAQHVRAPKVEKLRVLLLASSPEGDLRVGREIKRIRGAVESALHRDLIEFDVRTAATAADLLDGIVKFRPHVVHFSGHSNDDLIVLEEDVDDHNTGAIVSAATFAKALRATDDPPILVVLNACRSAHQIGAIVAGTVPFAIGMADEIEDVDAIAFAAQFYASVANGQSISSAHLAAQVSLELAGLPGSDLPTLASAVGYDPRAAILVRPLAEDRT
ncbi:CHAT domain-containing protein [Leifsonia naganoensis]|uniref:CHAT domain-containing protein n=1 Tax=Leifsonia naganoensis TaxID=150025 RepID=A0A853DIY7_9MICO|nr:CHAT domain-containing protein [Leifsonia naganoensis]NYK09036.1 hypothetical protein [Leifsonia naganoensis]